MTKSIQVLLIEDDDVDIQHFGRVLMKSGLNTDLKAVKDAKSGLAEVTANKYDIVFLDYKLPGSDGLKLLKQIRDKGIAVPIIVVTSQGDEQVAVNMMKAGASDYIPKTLMTSDGLTQSIRGSLRYNQLSRQSEQARKDLELAESKIKSIVGNFDIILFAVDRKGIVTLCEGKSMSSIGVTSENVLGKSIFKFLGRKRDVKQMIKEVLAGKEVRKTIEFDKVTFEFDCKPIIGKNGSVEGSFGIAKDITERVKSEQALLKAKNMAEKTAKIKESFLANMSHEIRTPMNAIIGFTDLLMEKGLNEEQKEFVGSIKQAGENLMVIINDILDFSKMEAGKLTIEKAAFSLTDTLNSLKSALEQKARDKGLRLLFDVDKDVPETLIGDSVRCYQILMNLVDNAIKFTEKGWIEVAIKTKKKANNDIELDFTITDTGIGIPENMLESIFESFTQATSYTTRKYGGTGLGLTIVKRLIDLQSGTLDIKSTEGKGTTFSFVLPFQRVQLRPVMGSESNIVAGDEKVLVGKRVLLVEDNVMNQMVARKHLERWKMKVDIAPNGIAAVDKAINNDYHLILMDVQMPLMNGYEATKRIRSKGGKFMAMPIFAMTAHAFEREKEKCLDAGMNEYISKPFKPETLKEKIMNILKSDTVRAEMTIGNSRRNICDLTMLKELADGDVKFMAEAIEMYIDFAAKSVTDMNKSFALGDTAAIRYQAHNLKSTVMMMGIVELNEILEKLDDEDANFNDMQLKLMIRRLDELVKQSTIELKERLNIIQFNYQMKKAG